MKHRVKIPPRWCQHRDVMFGFLSLQEAERIVKAGYPDDHVVTIHAYFPNSDTVGSTRTIAAAVNVRYKDKLRRLKRRQQQARSAPIPASPESAQQNIDRSARAARRPQKETVPPVAPSPEKAPSAAANSGEMPSRTRQEWKKRDSQRFVNTSKFHLQSDFSLDSSATDRPHANGVEKELPPAEPPSQPVSRAVPPAQKVPPTPAPVPPAPKVAEKPSPAPAARQMPAREEGKPRRSFSAVQDTPAPVAEPVAPGKWVKKKNVPQRLAAYKQVAELPEVKNEAVESADAGKWVKKAEKQDQPTPAAAKPRPAPVEMAPAKTTSAPEKSRPVKAATEQVRSAPAAP
ncbi:MAG TPA: hypothetical protein PLG66_14010, partial [Calditrichia bacterium]|nr:hypothetical protein [Calditrichia bacterium]